MGASSMGARSYGALGLIVVLLVPMFSCVLLYRSQGAVAAKRVITAQLQVGIGMLETITSLYILLAISNGVTAPEIGAYLYTGASIALLVGAFKLKKGS